jgi:hypothetical protein
MIGNFLHLPSNPLPPSVFGGFGKDFSQKRGETDTALICFSLKKLAGLVIQPDRNG